jgi:hypothetical protein
MDQSKQEILMILNCGGVPTLDLLSGSGSDGVGTNRYAQFLANELLDPAVVRDNSVAGMIEVGTGDDPIANSPIVVVRFNPALPVKPRAVLIGAANDEAAMKPVLAQHGNATADSFALTSQLALDPRTVYQFWYVVVF